KLLRNEKWQAAKLRKKELKRKRNPDDNSADSREVKPELTEEEKSRKRERKLKEQQDYLTICKRNYGIVIDCAWEHEHTDSTLISLVQQLSFCYGINRRSPTPSMIYVTGLGPRTKAQLSKNHAFNWTGVIFSDSEYTDISDLASCPDSDQVEALNSKGTKELVYLTSDATETLEALDENCVYIIGGIVDRNRLKGATYSKALQQGIRTAKLPIREHCQMKATHVLTINHVFDILKGFDLHHTWPEAIERVIPTRKKGELLGNVKARELKEQGGGESEDGSYVTSCEFDKEPGEHP
ncbi:trm10, partial [Symbiodinium microadriaticum]